MIVVVSFQYAKIGIKFDFEKNCTNFVPMKVLFFPIAALIGLFTCSPRSAGSPSTSISPEAAVEPSAVVEWDKTVHDFGDVSVDDGALSCSFTLKNVGQEPVVIYEVVSSCGCTDVKWTREPVAPGKTGSISATYKNEDGPMAFDKTLTVYLSGTKRPVVLRLRGVVHEKKKSLDELYGAEKMGDLGLKSRAMKTGTVKQGLQASETATVANLGRQPLNVSFADVSPALQLSVTPNPIPAGGTATLSYTVSARAEVYGRQVYTATPVLNGKKAAAPLEITAWTQENFALWSDRDRADAALPVFENSTFNFGIVPKGETVEVVFSCSNRGKSALHIYQADTESPALTLQEASDVPGGKKGSVRFLLDTSLLPKGENVLMVSLTTNAPLRPVVNLFVAGEVR